MTVRTLRSRLAVAFASFGYVGFAPVAPGTVGSAAAIPFFLLLRLAHSAWLEIAVCAAIVAAGAWSARITEQALGVEDPGPVVIDEVVGMFVSLLFLPATWLVVLAGFVAFRVFDIIKPWPADRFEQIPGGWGVMADDVMAGVYANLTLQFLLWARPGLLA
ncbi:MAG TPA: phosphatidylglycerophosphatase A [Vicinamibacterales bacterium]|nr:phosphatidylglycerophosphatase A [Vicinamibacterales bacterium]